jgi:hypothetical protein
MRGARLARRFIGRPPAGPPPDGYDEAGVRLLFDEAHYRRAHDRSIADPLADYLTTGWRRGDDPHPLFSTSWYLDEHRDVADAGVCPLVHYVRYGAREGRRPHPLFDPAYYRGRYDDVDDPSVDPLAHFVSFGGAEQRDPNPWFDSAFYASENPSVCAGAVPLLHYLGTGWRDGRDPHPRFDLAFYRSANPDVMGGEPLTHFLAMGRRAGREPCADFALRRVRRGVGDAPVDDRRLHVLVDEGTESAPAELLSRCPTIEVTSPSRYTPGASDDVYAPDTPDVALSVMDLVNVAVCLAHRRYDFVVVTHDMSAGSRITSASPANAVVVAGQWYGRRRHGRPLPVGTVGRIIRLPRPPGAALHRIAIDELGLGALLRFGAEVVVAGGAAVLAPDVAARRPAGPLITPPEGRLPDWLELDELGPRAVHSAMVRSVTR